MKMTECLSNWRWWVGFIPAMVIILAACFLTAFKILGYIAEWLFSVLHLRLLRPLTIWTWRETKRCSRPGCGTPTTPGPCAFEACPRREK